MNKGFHYSLDRQQIVDYMKITAEQKLEWLEEILLFSEEALTDDAKKVREHFRKDNGGVKL